MMKFIGAFSAVAILWFIDWRIRDLEKRVYKLQEQVWYVRRKLGWEDKQPADVPQDPKGGAAPTE
jgi:hypothetical protein